MYYPTTCKASSSASAYLRLCILDLQLRYLVRPTGPHLPRTCALPGWRGGVLLIARGLAGCRAVARDHRLLLRAVAEKVEHPDVDETRLLKGAGGLSNLFLPAVHPSAEVLEGCDEPRAVP